MSSLDLQKGLRASTPFLFTSDFRDMVWVGLGVGQSFWTGKLIQEHCLLVMVRH